MHLLQLYVVGLCLWVCAVWHCAAVAPFETAELSESFQYTADTSSGCAATDLIPIEGLNFTDEEKAVLPDICWRPELVEQSRKQGLTATGNRGVPPGVQCEVTQW